MDQSFSSRKWSAKKYCISPSSQHNSSPNSKTCTVEECTRHKTYQINVRKTTIHFLSVHCWAYNFKGIFLKVPCPPKSKTTWNNVKPEIRSEFTVNYLKNCLQIHNIISGFLSSILSCKFTFRRMWELLYYTYLYSTCCVLHILYLIKLYFMKADQQIIKKCWRI